MPEPVVHLMAAGTHALLRGALELVVRSCSVVPRWVGRPRSIYVEVAQNTLPIRPEIHSRRSVTEGAVQVIVLIGGGVPGEGTPPGFIQPVGGVKAGAGGVARLAVEGVEGAGDVGGSAGQVITVAEGTRASIGCGEGPVGPGPAGGMQTVVVNHAQGRVLVRRAASEKGHR